MLSTIIVRGDGAQQASVAHLTSYASLFVGFCLTLTGIFWLLLSQNLDAQGLSRPWPFTLGAITTYLALSQTVTAFMHEYLVGLEAVVEAVHPGVAGGTRSFPLGVLDHAPLSVLLAMGGAIWVLMTYAAPLSVAVRSLIPGGRRWVFAAYYFAIQVPVYRVYANAWHLQYGPADQPAATLNLLGLQFVQPLLWAR